MANLHANHELRGAQAFQNVLEDRDTKGFFFLFLRAKLTVTADVVEFTGPAECRQ